MDQEGEIVTAPVVFVMAEPELRMVREMGRRFAVAAGAALMALVLEGERALAPDGSANAQLIEQGDWDELPPDDRERQIIFYLEDCTGATLVRTYTPTEQGSLQPSTDHGENEAMIEEWWPLLPTNRLREHAGVARQN
jgi:hypothetical protein